MSAREVNEMETYGAWGTLYSADTYLVLPSLYNDIFSLEVSNIEFEGKIKYCHTLRKGSIVQAYNDERILYIILSGKLKTVCISPQYLSMYYQPPVYKAAESIIKVSILHELADRKESGWTFVEPPYIPNYHGFSFLNNILEFAAKNYLYKVSVNASATHRVTSNKKKDTVIEGIITYKTDKGDKKIPFKVSMLDWKHSFKDRDDVFIENSLVENILSKLRNNS
jgi:hypothetical protein